MLFISIPKPCHENWNEMSPREQGAFCNVCSKTVIDFTALSDEQVRNYFLENRGNKTCGRLRKDQLTNDADYLPKILTSDIPLWKKFLAAVVILFGSLLTGCKENVTGKIPAPVKIEATIGDIKNEKPGALEIEPDTLLPRIATITVTTVKGFTLPEIVGDIEIGAVIVMPENQTPDTAMVLPVVNDTVTKVKPVIKGCSDKKDSLIYLDPE